MSSPAPAPASAVAATHPTDPAPPMSPVARIVQDTNNHFTDWLEFYNCEVQGAVLSHSIAIGHLTIDGMNRVRDLLECHGWRTSLYVEENGTHLSLGRAAAPISDGTAEFEAAILAMEGGGEEKEEATTTTACGICKVAEAVNPHCIDTCCHVFCFACITSDPTMACPTCSAPYHIRNIAAV